jgi:hypothetical protein
MYTCLNSALAEVLELRDEHFVLFISCDKTTFGK